jgi:hypothetical protein
MYHEYDADDIAVSNSFKFYSTLGVYLSEVALCITGADMLTSYSCMVGVSLPVACN